MSGSRGRYRRRSEKEWIEIFKRFELSGLGPGAFCRRGGLPLSSFRRWRRRLASSSEVEFVELVPAIPPAETPEEPVGWSPEVALPNGACLRFRG